jgi:hypothetical protein
MSFCLCTAKSASNPAPYSTVESQIVGIHRGRCEISSTSGKLETLAPPPRRGGWLMQEKTKWRGGVSTIDCDGNSSVGEDKDVTKIWMSRHGKL